MRVYVIGAGVSKTVGYPLGVELFNEIDRFVQESGPCIDRFDYRKDWPALCNWLKTNTNPLIQEAYQKGQLEQLFTILDLASFLRLEALTDILRASKGGAPKVAAAEESWKGFDHATKDYRDKREVLLWALEQFFEYKHNQDAQARDDRAWDPLHRLAKVVHPSDVVITFNYDSTIERALLDEKKWTPRDGYGFEVVFQRSNYDKTPVEFGKSPVLVLHLHGAVGWYDKPVFRPGYDPPPAAFVARENLSPAPLDTPLALDPLFLRDLHINAVDACLPNRPAMDRQVLLHPSFLKEYEFADRPNYAFMTLWKAAGEALRRADEVVVIGYSLPRADSAALTLLSTNCDRAKVHVVNPSVPVSMRLRQLLSAELAVSKPLSLEDWLHAQPACP